MSDTPEIPNKSTKPDQVKQKLFGPNWRSLGGKPQGSYDAFGGQPEPGKADLVAAYSDIVYAAIKLIQRKISRVKLRLYATTETGEARPKCKTTSVTWKNLKSIKANKSISFSTQLGEVVEHPLLDLLDKANPQHNRGELIGITQLFLDLTGNAYWLIIRDDFGLPQSLYPLPSQCVELVRDENQIVRGVKYYEGEKEYDYLIEDIIHFREDNPLDVYGEGHSPVRAMWQRIQVGWKEISYLDNTLSNNARPDVMVSPKSEHGFGQDEAERMAKDFGHRFRGSGNGGAFIATDPVDFEILQWQPKDLAELELYKNLKISILNGLHIPPELFEIGEANRSTAEAALYSLYANCIRPRIELIVDKLNEKLVPLYDKRLFIHFDEVVPEDKSFDLQERDMLLKNGVITRSEARRLYGFEAFDWGDEPLIPSGMLPSAPAYSPSPMLADDHQQAPAVAAPATPAAPDGQAQPAADSLRATVGGSQQVMAMQAAYYSGQLPREAAVANARIIFGFTEAEAEALFPEIKPQVLAPAAATQETQVPEKPAAKAILPPMRDKAPDPLVQAINEFFAHQRATVLGQKSFTDDIETKAFPDGGFFDIDKWTDEMFQRMLPVVEMFYDHSAGETVARLGGDAGLLKVVQPNLKEALSKATLLFCRTTNESTSQDLTKALEDLRQQIAEGLEVGDVKNAMKDRVQQVFNGLDNERAYMIGHTEASRAQHDAMMITAKESGVAKAKRWILSSDACPTCKPLAGKTVGLDEPFVVDGLGAYGEINSPPRHPLCRCAMSLVTEGVND
ncbi:phage portal protein [Zavarzinella formosa]|uniref:phage portal protein n=1 Tax=Zavarzinella formosa TaxID=360055 RepID=UPI0002DF03D6|nr:phage portal protein [Zavarzinella formosa]